ncbi:MAG: hypothetical protein FWF76_04570, partial [Oscillospiraceae bacterium]|nr:hypothetical protein [Oscillospiraceae bacterium]
MSLINREILHFKHAPNVTQERELEGLPNYEAIRPASLTNDDDFSCILNFFRKIIDETKLDGVKYANTSLLKHHIGHFCLNSGTVLFKIVEKKRGSGVAELYGYFTPLSEARTMWLDISKLFYQLTVEMPGSAQNAPFDYEKLQALSVNDIKNAQPIYRSSMENMLSELQNSAFPMNAVLSSLPESFYPSGVKVFPNGMVLEKTDGVQKEVLLSFDDAQISTHMKECNEPLKSASLASVPYVDDDKKSGGLFKLKKNDKTTAKAINQWYYKYTTDGQAQQQNCDFIKLNKPLEYSPVSDTFAAYTGRLGANADVLPVVESATVYVPPASETKAMVVTSVGTPPPLQKQSTPELSSAPPPKPTLPSSPKAVKPPKPSKPEKKKPVGKVHPLLAQAEEREEATTV